MKKFVGEKNLLGGQDLLNPCSRKPSGDSESYRAGQIPSKYNF